MSETTSTATMAGDGEDASRAEGDRGLVLVHAQPPTSAARAFVLRGRSAVLGREPPAGGFAIQQAAVSRLHAALEVGPAGAELRDLASRNGVFVNGARVARASLRAGDVVRLGDAVFVYVDAEAEAHLAHPLEGRSFAGLVGGHAMAKVAAAIDAFARADAAVLVTGETGVGKELVARALHAGSGRRGRLAAINAAALPATLFESELFGAARGAFTGADRAREGLVRSAEGGTLFLDEIGDLPLEVQAKLLRLLENREILPLGTTQALRVDVRVVCATHRDLPALVREGRFRGDLYARIAQRVIAVPPLRARREDLYALVLHVLGRRRAIPTFPFLLKLAHHDWPFNVRELVAAVEHAVDLAGEGELRPQHLPASVAMVPAPASPGAARSPAVDVPAAGPRPRRRGPSAAELAAELTLAKGNVAAVARQLDRDPAQVYRWLRQFQLDPDDFR